MSQHQATQVAGYMDCAYDCEPVQCHLCPRVSGDCEAARKLEKRALTVFRADADSMGAGVERKRLRIRTVVGDLQDSACTQAVQSVLYLCWRLSLMNRR